MIESAPATSANVALWRGLPSLHFARKGVTVLGVRIAAAGLALALQVSLARVLGDAGYGRYAYVVAWLQLLLMFAQGGFSMAALRYVAEYRARSQPELVRGFLKRSSQIVLVESVVLAMLMAGCAFAIGRYESSDLVLNLLIASVALPILARFTLSTAFVRGWGQVIRSMLVAMAYPASLLASLLTIAYVCKLQVSSTEALVFNAGAALIALGVVVSLQKRLEKSLDESSPPTFLTREWLSTATHMMFAWSLIYLQGRTGVIITGLFLDAGATGIYAAMERIADVTLLGLVSMNLLVAPKIAALHAQQRHKELQRIARLAAWGSTSFMLATMLPLVLFGKPLLLLFGEAFVSGYPALLLLLCGVAVNALCGSVGLFLSMTGHHRVVVLVAFCSLSVNLILSPILIPRYGIIGSALATATSLATWNICMLLLVRRRLGIWSCLGHIGW